MGTTPTARQIEETARTGADSVYGYVERTAEPVPDGVRWQTLSWENEPHYDPSVFNGVAGIVFFLADYYRLTGVARALDLAWGAVRWCSSPERTVGPEAAWLRDGLVRGRAGVGMAWLRLAAVTGDAQTLAPAAAIGEDLLRKDPGPVTDWQDGATGEGVFLLRLAEASREERFLAGAVRRGAWLASVALRNGRGCYWPWEVGESPYATWYGLSFIPGMAGIGHFLLSLYQATRDPRWVDLAREAGETLRRQATPDRGGLNWPDTLDGRERGEELRCQWCYGAPGVGLFFAKAYEALGSGGPAEYLATAEAAGETTFQYGDVRRNAVQCHGLAGNAELLLELYRATRRQLWLDRAHDFATRAFAYRLAAPEGDVWQADDPGYASPDFLFGAAGTGHFFLRLWRPDQLTRPLL
jgi:lantibiotic modifying enzyme